MEIYDRNAAGYTMNCSIWYVYEPKAKHSCGCVFWETCIEKWVMTCIKTRNLEGQDPVPCLSNAWRDGITFEDLQKVWSKKAMIAICEGYNESYFTNTSDISRCPKGDCNYAGFIKVGACRDNLQCKKCNYEWRDHANLTICEKVSQSVKNILTFNPESFNYLTKVMWSTPCPGCGMFIQKAEGWAHMVWQYCKYEFCWIWLGHYPGYVHRNGDICGIRKIMSVGFMIAAITLWFIYFMYQNNYASFFLKLIMKSIFKFVFANLAVISIFANLGFSLSYSEKVRNGYYYSAWDQFIVYLLAALTMVWPMVWGYCMYSAWFSDFWCFVPWWPIVEAAAILGICLLGLAIYLVIVIVYFLILKPLVFLFKLGVNGFRKVASICRRDGSKSHLKSN